jgi:hypothetical protein
MGFRDGHVEIPAPHVHHYHPEFDGLEKELLLWCDGVKTPLMPADEQ